MRPGVLMRAPAVAMCITTKITAFSICFLARPKIEYFLFVSLALFRSDADDFCSDDDIWYRGAGMCCPPVSSRVLLMNALP